MRRCLLLCWWGVCAWLGDPACLAQPITCSGFVLDSASGERISGARITHPASGRIAITNQYGFFSLALPSGPTELWVRASGHLSQRLSITLQGDSLLRIPLVARTLAGVDILGEVPSLTNQEPGKVSIPVTFLKKLPALLGEQDILKTITLTPGVNLALEGSSGLVVRGGRPDQNLILLDGARVFNPTHLLGLFSVFNAEAISKVDVYKGHPPAKFGGRLSSVLDVHLKEGNQNVFEGQASIGLLTSQVLAQGPIGDRTSYLLAGRASYLGILLLPVYVAYLNGQTDAYANYWLYDFNGKINHTYPDHSRLLVSFYTGQDHWSARDGDAATDEDRGTFSWANQTLTLRYHRLLGQKVFWQTQATASRYRFRQETQETFRIAGNGNLEPEVISFTSEPGLQNYALSSRWDIYPGEGHRLELGLQWDVMTYQPIRYREQSSLSDEFRVDQQVSLLSHEPQAWIQDTWQRGPWRLDVGLRFHGELQADTFFRSLEPRVSLSRQLISQWHFSLAWARASQFMHQLSATQLGLPGDVWLPATRFLPPQRGNQWSTGVAGKWSKYEVSIEGYYRHHTNLTLYQPPNLDVGVILSDGWQRRLLRAGEGRAYGLEVMLGAQFSRLQGWLSYSLAWSEIRFPNFKAGAWQLSPYDQRHTFHLVGVCQLKPRWQMSGTWTYHTGRLIYLPGSQVPTLSQGPVTIINPIPQRLPAYHRLDLGWEYTTGRQTVWRFGVYNAYNQLNPLFVRVRKPTARRPGGLRGVAVGPLLPYLSYSWRF